MKRSNKNLLIFLSPPCDLVNESLITDSSWYKFALNFGNYGDNLNIISPILKNNKNAFKIKQKKLCIKKINHFYFNSFKSYYKKFFLNFFKTMRVYCKEIKAADVIIYRIPNPGFTIINLISIFFQKPVIVFISGNIIYQSDSFLNSSGIKKAFFKVFLKIRIKLHQLMFLYSSYIFPVSSELVDLYKINKKSNVVILRTPVISSKDIIKEPNKTFNYSRNNKLKIIRACWLQESKGIENLINAIKILNNKYTVKLDIYGDAKEEDYKSKLENLIQKLYLSDNVKLKGWISNSELINIYDNYDLHVMSSKSEGMPRVCVESSSRGLPQILTPVGGVNDFYTHMYDAYICDDYSIDSIQKGILWFMDNPEASRRIVSNSIENAKKSTVEEVSARFNKILEKVLL